MITITVDDEFDDYEQAADALERIADLLRSGYTSGCEPIWSSRGQPEDTDERNY